VDLHLRLASQIAVNPYLPLWIPVLSRSLVLRNLVIELRYHSHFETTALLLGIDATSYAAGNLPEPRKTACGGKGVGMGVWKRQRAFNWELVFGISGLVLAFMVMGALLTYQNFVSAGR